MHWGFPVNEQPNKRASFGATASTNGMTLFQCEVLIVLFCGHAPARGDGIHFQTLSLLFSTPTPVDCPAVMFG